MKTVNQLPILFFKDQGEDNDLLLKEDFLLVIMTDFQRNQWTQFGINKIYINGSYGVDDYNFQLFTLVVVDDFGNGIPVSFCFSNHNDIQIFEIYFECVRTWLESQTEVNIFMSDDNPPFYSV